MTWQDALFFSGSIALGLGLVPSIWSSDKPAVKTSLMTAAVLASFCVAYVTLHLWAATVGTAVDTLGWLVLLVQKVKSPSRDANDSYRPGMYLNAQGVWLRSEPPSREVSDAEHEQIVDELMETYRGDEVAH